MGTLSIRITLGAFATESQPQHPKINQSQDRIVLTMKEVYIIQVSVRGNRKKSEKKLFQQFSSMENQFLGALLMLDDLFLNSQVRVPSGTFPGTS